MIIRSTKRILNYMVKETTLQQYYQSNELKSFYDKGIEKKKYCNQ